MICTQIWQWPIIWWVLWNIDFLGEVLLEKIENANEMLGGGAPNGEKVIKTLKFEDMMGDDEQENPED